MKVILFIFLAVSLVVGDPGDPIHGSTKIAQPRKSDVNYRLPGNIRPSHYELVIEPIFESFTFRGHVKIEARTYENLQEIILHADYLNITGLSVTSKNQNLKVASTSYEELRSFYKISLEESVNENTDLEINIDYIGILNDNIHGFYRAKYYDEKGSERWLATTHFEATFARQAFPCFDEPAMKATFTINIIRPKTYSAISNMPLLTSVNLGVDRVLDTFATTPIMSTYIVGFVVSDYEFVQNGMHSVYAKKMDIQQGNAELALATSPAIIEIMQEFTDTPYNMTKMAQVAVPILPVGAMENWGIVIYREGSLLYVKNVTTTARKQSIQNLIGHEYSHQWFGNLVSPAWWEYLWLNEGFATYFEYYAMSVHEPSWRLMELFVIKSYQYAFEVDATEDTRPMSMDAGSPDEIQDLFDGIAYDKSGVVLRMVQNFLSMDTFRKGLKLYLAKNKYKSATPEDLFDALQTAAEEDETFLDNMTVAEIMKTWHRQKGYPLITATRYYNKDLIHLKQHRYLSNGKGDESAEMYIVPINIATASDDFNQTTPTYWLKEREGVLNGPSADSWIILNKQVTGYYRVNYDGENWRLLIEQLLNDHEVIPPVNRAQLIDDAFDLTNSGDVAFTVPLELMQYISNETDFMALKSLFNAILDVDRLIVEQDYYPKFKENMVNLLSLAYNKDGSLSEVTGNVRIENRNQIMYWLCYFGHEDCLKSTNEFLLGLDGHVDPDLQAAVYCGGMRLDEDSHQKWQTLFVRYSNIADASERSRLLTGLSCSSDKLLLERMLDMVIEKSEYKFKAADRTTAFRVISTETYQGTQAALNYLMQNFKEFTIRFTSWDVYNMMYYISIRLTTEGQKELLKNFVENNELTGVLKMAFDDAIRNVDHNLAWLRENGADFARFYKK